jgi:hypothetical protein
MLFNDGNLVILPQDCHEAISNFVDKQANNKLNRYNCQKITQEVTQKVIEVIKCIYDIFYTMQHITFCISEEYDFIFPHDTAHLTLLEIDLINQVANRIFHGSIEVAEKEPDITNESPFKICDSIFHSKIFKTNVRSECTIKCTSSVEHDEILKPQNIRIISSSEEALTRIENILNHLQEPGDCD